MTNNASHTPPTTRTEPVQKLLARLPLYLSLGALGIYILIEHRAHLLGVLPYLLFMACPLMHLFGHGHHGHGEHNHAADRRSDSKEV